MRAAFAPLGRLRAKTRLLLAFSILFLAAMGLALVGWLGLSNTERALQSFERRALPDIAQSLELAERTANLAAVAPYVASTRSPFMLRGLSQTLEEKIQRVLKLARQTPQLDAAAPNLRALLERLERTVNELIELTRAQLFLREDIRQFEYRLNGLGESLAGSSTPRREALLRQLELLLAASQAPSDERLARLQRRFREGLTQLSAAADAPGDRVAVLRRIGEGDESLFALRAEQLAKQKRSAFLLAATRAVSEQLSGEVQRFVDQVQGRISAQSRRVGGVVASGKSGILVITLLCVLAALGGVWMVRELVTQLGAVTGLMSRLAAGDTHLPTPAVTRHDEIGDLARAFQVFRDNALAIGRISEDLKAQTHLLETVFDNINDGLSVFDRDGRLLAWNPQYLSILELPAAQLRAGMTLDEVHGLLSAEARASWALDGGALDKDELNRLRQRQSQRFERHFASGRVVEFRSSPMPDGGFVTLYSDLTERKAVEAQLRQAQKMEVLGQLTGGVAHDFNNLLAAMFGNLQLLEDCLEPGSRALTYARRALAAAERGGNLTQRLLAFSRKQHLTPEATGVDALIEGMLDLLEYSVGAHIEIQLDLEADGWIVQVDPGQLENALLNLAINASAAMAGGGTLRFATRGLHHAALERGAGEAVQIQVSDNGSGIPAEHLRRVFEPFFTTKAVGEGSGLGLSMVYGFVKQSQGDIRIDSTPGQGTTVAILLPRAQPAAALAPASTPPPPLGQGRWVLMVEDDPPVRQAGEELLRRLGYRVVTVDSAEAALATLEQRGEFALLFSDINLGAGANGVQLARRVRRRWPQLALLLTSGLSTQQLGERYGLAESTPVLAKPYRREQLAAALAQALARPAGA